MYKKGNRVGLMQYLWAGLDCGTYRCTETLQRLTQQAERMGFEPMKPFWSLHTFQACAFDQLGHLSITSAKIVKSL